MKNRLQFNYYIPSAWPYTREQAVAFIETLYSKNVGANASLPAEPNVVYYGKNRDNCNVILAIGRGGDGTNNLNNRPYFLIDSAKLEEHLANVDKTLGVIDRELQRINTEIQAIKAKDTEQDNLIKILNNEAQKAKADRAALWADIARVEGILNEDIANLNAEIERAKAEELRLNGRCDQLKKNIDNEIDRAEEAETALSEKIDKETIRATEVENGLQLAVDTLNTNLNAEIANREAAVANATAEAAADRQAIRGELETRMKTEQAERQDADNVLNAKIDAEISTRSTNVEDLQLQISNEILRAQNREQEIENKHTLELSTEVSNRESGDIQTLADAKVYTDEKLAVEIERSLAADADHTNKIKVLTSETQRQRGEDERLAAEIVNTENRLDAKITKNKVVAVDKTILLDETGENTNIRVNIDGNTIKSNDGILTVDSSALVQYHGDSCIKVATGDTTNKISLRINPNDNILVNEREGLFANLSLKWVKETDVNQIQLIGKEDTIISTIDVAEFLKDGILEKVELVDYGGYRNIKFTFNTGEVIHLNVDELITDLYEAGDGLQLVGTTFSIKRDVNCEDFLTLTAEGGLKLSGVADYVTTSVQALDDELLPMINTLNENVNDLQGRDTELHNEIVTGLTEVRGYVDAEIAEFSTQLTEGYTALGDIIRGEFAAADKGIYETIETLRTDDSNIRGEFAAADSLLGNRITNLETYTTAETTRIDGITSGLRTDLTNEITERKTAVAQALTDAKAYTDGRENVLVSNISEIKTIANGNTESIKTLNGDANTIGSIPYIMSESMIANKVTDMPMEDAKAQTLLKQIALGGRNYYYASNMASDIIYAFDEQGNATSLVKFVDDMKKSNDEMAAKIVEFNTTLKEMENRIDYLESAEYRQSLIDEVSNGIINTILNSIYGTEEQIKITKTFKTNEDNSLSTDIEKLTIGFADGVVFQAGV